jgi:hypothetical protein
MRSIHLHDIHVPKGPNLWFVSAGAVVCFGIALITFVISWLGGGDPYAESLGGGLTLGILVAGLLASIACAVITKPKE